MNNINIGKAEQKCPAFLKMSRANARTKNPADVVDDFRNKDRKRKEIIMFDGEYALEARMIVERKLNEFEDMLKRTFPELNKDSGIDIKKYVEKRLKDSECYDVPCNEVYSTEEWLSLERLAQKNNFAAIRNALVIGFVNGVERERKSKDSP